MKLNLHKTYPYALKEIKHYRPGRQLFKQMQVDIWK